MEPPAARVRVAHLGCARLSAKRERKFLQLKRKAPSKA